MCYKFRSLTLNLFVTASTDGVQFRTADNASALVSIDTAGRVTMPYQPALLRSRMVLI